MNNSKSSRFSIRSHRPDSFRVMMKQRTNHKEQLVEAKRVSASQLIKREAQISSPISQMNRTQNYSEMKDYVRNRMKTQYGERFASNSLHKITLIDSPKQSPQAIRKKPSTIQPSETLHQANSSFRKSLVQLNHSQTMENKNNKQEKEKMSNYETIDRMEQKIQDLLQKRLKICYNSKSNRDQLVEKQLQKMVVKLRNLRKEDPETIDTHISYFDKKVKLFQRLMAQSLTESQIMKKAFLAKMSNPSRHKRFNTEIQTSSSKLSMNRYNQTPVRTSIINSSINKQTFKTPEPYAYKIYKHQNIFFNADRHRQPLPRSSYNREYLICPQTMDRQVLPIDNEFIGKTNSANLLQTSYRQSFIPKQVEKINLKELDACKDKIKNIPVLYGRATGNKMSPNSYNAFIFKIKQASEKKKPPLSPQSPSYKQLLSESRREYKKPEGKVISSQIKHQNLHKLKFQYRKKIFV